MNRSGCVFRYCGEHWAKTYERCSQMLPSLNAVILHECSAMFFGCLFAMLLTRILDKRVYALSTKDSFDDVLRVRMDALVDTHGRIIHVRCPAFICIFQDPIHSMVSFRHDPCETANVELYLTLAQSAGFCLDGLIVLSD